MISATTAIDLIKDFQHCDYYSWKRLFEQYKARVHKTGYMIFVQESPQQQMVYLVYMHHQITKNMVPSYIRQNIRNCSHRSITIHVPTKQIVHCFGPSVYVYGKEEIDEFVEESVFFAKEHQKVSIEEVQFGFLLAARFWQGEWLLGSPVIINANEATFGSEFKLVDEFRRIYSEQDLDALDKNLIHVFRLCSNNFAPFHINESVQLLESRDPLTGQLVSSYRFTEEQMLNRDHLRQYLTQICDQMSDDKVLNEYQLRNVLISSILVRMDPYYIQIDSSVQQVASDCSQQYAITKKKQTLKEFIAENISMSPFLQEMQRASDKIVHSRESFKEQNEFEVIDL